MREFRQPTRFSRPGADATLALEALRERRAKIPQALAAVRADLLDTYQARLSAALEDTDQAAREGHAVSAAAAAALAHGYGLVLRDAYEEQRGAVEAARLEDALERLAAEALGSSRLALEDARASVEDRLTGFRAAPLAAEEEVRRAGQILRFLALVPIEYDRGVEDGRVTLDFEIQEAITFRDGAAQAFADLESRLTERDPEATARMAVLLDALGADLAEAAAGSRVAQPEDVEGKTDESLELAEQVFPEPWLDAGETADFDVIRTTLNRLEGAAAAGEYGKAEQARLEAYAFFEFGPEQRLRGLASDLFVRVEGLFWYGGDGLPGLAQLVKRKAAVAEIRATRVALDEALADAEQAIGSGATSNSAVVSNTAIIVFREGLEAVLILAALMAGMAGTKRRFRRPLLAGVAAALVATALTWIAAQTVLGSLSRYGERLEAVVSLVAIAVLLLVMNWFYHRVYWSDHLASLHGRKKKLLRRAGLSLAFAQVAGLAALGFSSVYREGFETVLFLQALVFEAGPAVVLAGVALGLVGVTAVGLLTIALQRRLPHKKMLMVTGLLITWVLVVMVGTTVQKLQVAGWIPVHPIGDLRLPYWSGLWFGVFPTWEGLLAQASAAVVVIGSYFAAEGVRKRRRRLRFATPPPVTAVLETPAPRSNGHAPPVAAPEREREREPALR